MSEKEVQDELWSFLCDGAITLRRMLNLSAEHSGVERAYTGQRGSFARVDPGSRHLAARISPRVRGRATGRDEEGLKTAR